MIKKTKALVIIICLAFLVTGCWDADNIEDRTIVYAFAVDKKHDDYEVSLQVLKTSSGSGKGEGAGSSPTTVLSGQGENFDEALVKISNKINYNFFFGKAFILAFSEEVAKEGIDNIIETFRRKATLRRDILPVVTKGPAKDILAVHYPPEPNSTFYIKNMMNNPKMYNDSKYYNYLGEVMVNQSDPIMATEILAHLSPAKDKKSVELLGLAVLKKQKFIDGLNEMETNIVNNLRHKLQGGTMIIPCKEDEKEDYINFLPGGVDWDVEMDENQTVNYKIDITGYIMHNSCKESLDNKDSIEKLQNKIANFYQKEAKKLIEKSQKDYEADLFALGFYLRGRVDNFEEKYPDWFKAYPKLKINVKYTATISGIGIEAK